MRNDVYYERIPTRYEMVPAVTKGHPVISLIDINCCAIIRQKYAIKKKNHLRFLFIINSFFNLAFFQKRSNYLFKSEIFFTNTNATNTSVIFLI